jgi:toxin ParE1/3/4
MIVEVSDAARADVAQIADYYEQQRPGLGREFVVEFNEVLDRIGRYPHGWTKVSRRSRRCLFKRFDYGAFYRFRGDIAVVFAVWHLMRRPGWRARERL